MVQYYFDAAFSTAHGFCVHVHAYVSFFVRAREIAWRAVCVCGLAVIALSAFGLAISFVLPFVLSQQKSAFDRCVPPVSLSLLRMIEMRLTFLSASLRVSRR